MNPAGPPFQYTDQHVLRAHQQNTYPHYVGDRVSPAYPTSGGSGGGHYTTTPVMNDHFELPPAKRQKVSGAGGSRRPSHIAEAAAGTPDMQAVMDGTFSPYSRGKDVSQRDEEARSRQQSVSMEPSPSTASPVISKPKRVRTGCLTCRNRHLKCDEAMPVCVNCQKSNRKCERGIRLNFIDLKVQQPPYLLPPVDWKVQFQDESRQIASEYVGGLARYAKLRQQVEVPPGEASVNAESRRVRTVDSVLKGPGHSAENSRLGLSHAAQSIYHPGGLSRSYHEPTYNGYEDAMGQAFSRKSSDPFLAMVSGPTPTSSHSGGGGRGGSFSLGTGQDSYAIRDEGMQPMHAYKSSDASSVASSLVAQGIAASSSGSYRHATGSGAPDPHDGLMTPQSEKNGERDYLNNPEELHYMQVFIDEVAVWMDSLDNQKHFGRVIPYLALKSPMLLNAFLACGVKHLTLVDRGSYNQDRALHYYDTATTQLLRSLQNPERNTVECATTAVVLNVYEIMSEKPAARMNHIAGARALIRECKWDARSTGIGAACFWLNVGMEILSCLAFNWATAWNPDDWGINPEELMNMTADSPGVEGKTPNMNSGGRPSILASEDFPSSTSSFAGVGDEEIWVRRILYVVAKVANFRALRATIPQFQESSPHEEQVKLQSRFAEWQRLRAWCDTWNANCPRSMRPYGYLFASSTKSAFPNVWLIKRSAIVGRLFYHTAMCLLAQVHPLKPHQQDDEEVRATQLHHAHQVCGIAAHTTDHGVSSVAIRSLAIAGSVLTDSREQHEVLDILTRINLHTGWNLHRVHTELKRAWGWEPPEPPPSGPGLPPHPAQQPLIPAAQGGTLGAAAVLNQLFGQRDQQQQQQQQDAPPPPALPAPMQASMTEARRANLATGPPPSFSVAARHSSIASASSSHASPASVSTPPSARPMVNPLLAQADFTQPNHPYREWYKPPERVAERVVERPPEKTDRLGGGHGHGHGVSFGGGGLWPY